MAMPSLGLFSVSNPADKAMQGLGQAANTYAAMDKERKSPGKTVGGGLMSAAGMGVAGGEAEMMLTGAATAGPWGLAGGATLGALSYFLS